MGKSGIGQISGVEFKRTCDLCGKFYIGKSMRFIDKVLDMHCKKVHGVSYKACMCIGTPVDARTGKALANISDTKLKKIQKFNSIHT